MATATEGYVEAQTGRLRAEAQSDIAAALLSREASAKRDLLWIIGWMTGLVGLATGLIIAVLK